MPKPTRTWAKGPSLSSPAAELVAWFDAQAPRMTRVALVRKDGQWMIGALAVRVSDHALGISIAMRARKCTGPACAFIVEGYWRGGEYEIREASSSPITAAELAAFTHAEVATP